MEERVVVVEMRFDGVLFKKRHRFSSNCCENFQNTEDQLYINNESE